MKKNRKNRSGIVYSTKEDFEYNYDNAEEEPDTPEPENQNLIISIDSKQRKGKIVTVISNFTGQKQDIENLARLLKNKCGVGGSVKDNNIIIQGKLENKIFDILIEMNFVKTKIK